MDVNLRRQTLADTLRRSAQRVPDRLGLACGSTRWTYREFLEVSERLAGLSPGAASGAATSWRSLPATRTALSRCAMR